MPEQAVFAALLQCAFQRFEQVAVFTAQVEITLARADHAGAQGHALENAVGVAIQQDPVLEGARLAFIGIAHDVTVASFGLLAKAPFHGGAEACATAAAQAGLFDGPEHGNVAVLKQGTQGAAIRAGGCCVVREQQVAPPDIVFNLEKFGRPL